jgi:ribonuclease Z
VLRLAQQSSLWLFDCGEGTQHQFLRSSLHISKVSKIFISHLHGDHVYGLAGLLSTCGLAGDVQKIEVYGPPGLVDFVESNLRHTQTTLPFDLELVTVNDGIVYEDDRTIVRCAWLEHGIPVAGYRVEEKDRPGRFDAYRAAMLGIPPGPIYGRLKLGETMVLDDGRVVGGSELCGPQRHGRSMVYCTDTTYCSSGVELATGADLLVHEATFAQSLADLARRSGHSTASIAAQVALEAGVRELILTHISPRYVEGGDIAPEDLLVEARAIFPATRIAYDMLTVDLPMPGD